MDLTLAYHVGMALAKNGTKLDANQMTQLTYASLRNAKEEQLFADPETGVGPGDGAGQGAVGGRRVE